jgi:hypothetical protein
MAQANILNPIVAHLHPLELISSLFPRVQSRGARGVAEEEADPASFEHDIFADQDERQALHICLR